MCRICLPLILCLLLVAATGCEKKAAPKEPAATPAADVTQAPAAAEPVADKLASAAQTAAADDAKVADAPSVITVSSREVEVGCGMCIYAIKGVTSCSLAAKIDGKPYVVKGASIDAHKAGLCGGTKLAKCEGRIEGDTFFATHFSLNE